MTAADFIFVPSSKPDAWPAELSCEAFLAVAVWPENSVMPALKELFPKGRVPVELDTASQMLLRAFKPGVTNPMSQSLARVLGVPDSKVRVDRVIVSPAAARLAPEQRQKLEWLWREPAIEDLEVMSVEDWLKRNARELLPAERSDDSFEIGAPSKFDLEFEEAELQALEAEASRRGRSWNRTELEVFAQTWSEHCKHKIFGARIATKDTAESVTDGLFATHIRKPTLDIQRRRPKRYLSIFHDNAGVLALDTEEGKATDWAFCLKMETHNSPSAISPYGGASTGIVGVHRDILGTGIGALPVANWDVLCFEEPGPHARPSTALPPEVVRKGVIKGIEDGGNQSGIPTVQGSVVFDPAFAVKPLVFAGSIGIMPKNCVDKKPRPGLALYCFGGSTGADGLRGAVMSSRDLRASDFRGSAVQVASAFVQRCLTDFLMEARDRGLIDVVTDNGAGGLASSVGEMATLTNGADIDLSHLRLKFEGLHGWERLLSESQERMTVATSQPEALEACAHSWGVGFDKLGELTCDGIFRVRYQDKTLVEISIDFLHKGCPRMELASDWTTEREQNALQAKRESLPARLPDIMQDFPKMLLSPHLASREGIVRCFDHEVQGRTLRKPFAGRFQNTPQDGSRIEIPETEHEASIVLAHGLSPQRADVVENVVHSFDEALRAAVLTGIQLDTAGMLDNFCWPDPITRPGAGPEIHRRLWRLVRSCETLSQLCRSFELPLVSGKDSMKNNSRDFAALETIVLSVGGSGSSRFESPGGFFSRANEVVFLVPPERATLRNSAWERVFDARSTVEGAAFLKASDAPSQQAEIKELALFLRKRYERMAQGIGRGLLRSAKDISEGGSLHAVFEMCLGRGLGLHFEAWDPDPCLWFGEGLGGFVISVDPHLVKDFSILLPEAKRIGVTMNVPVLRWGVNRELALAPLLEAYERANTEGFWK